MRLKVGYFTLLTIIAERNTSNAGNAYCAYRQPTLSRCPASRIHIRKTVIEATNPAAAGMGKPTNSLE